MKGNKKLVLLGTIFEFLVQMGLTNLSTVEQLKNYSIREVLDTFVSSPLYLYYLYEELSSNVILNCLSELNISFMFSISFVKECFSLIIPKYYANYFS